MTDVAIRNGAQLDIPAGTEPATVQLAQWAVAADAAHAIATRLVTTSFAPAAYRGKPDEATAAILAGAEVGLSPTASLRAFDNIQGTPAPKAMTLRAIVQGQGHEVRIDESTADRAAVSGRRKGDIDWQTSTWTIDRAREMGLLGKDQWKKQPAAMLVARATAEVCRWIASDAIMGMPYTVEEIRDHGGDFEARPGARRLTAADILHQPAAIEAPVDPIDPAGVFAAADEHSRPIEDKQKRHIFALLGELGIADRGARLDGISKVIGREVGSTNDLTAAEADQVVTSLRASVEQRERAA